MTDRIPVDHDRIDRVAELIVMDLTRSTDNPLEGLLAIQKAFVIVHKSLDMPLEDAITKLRETWEAVNVQDPS